MIFFIGYLERSKGYRIYFLSHIPQIVEINRARFLDDGMFNESGETQGILFKEIQEINFTPKM